MITPRITLDRVFVSKLKPVTLSTCSGHLCCVSRTLPLDLLHLGAKLPGEWEAEDEHWTVGGVLPDVITLAHSESHVCRNPTRFSDPAPSHEVCVLHGYMHCIPQRRQLSSQANRALTSLVTPSKPRWQERHPQRSSCGRAYAGFAGHEAGFRSATCKDVGEEVTKGAVKYLDVR